MKILFLISSRVHGRGGHFHSLNDISTAIAKHADVEIITIGRANSAILQANEHFNRHLLLTGKNFFSFRKNLQLALKEINPDIIHCFDVGSYDIVKLSCVNFKGRLLLSKCGGANPVSFPMVEHLILFSIENLNWFKNKGFKNLTHIPNRVNTPEAFVKPENYPSKDAAAFTFMRICRIGNTYKNSIIIAINLIKQLQENYKVKLIVVGVIESEEVFNSLQKLAESLPVEFITNHEYTLKASKMLYLADAVIGTGRSAMEATSAGIPVLTPVKGKSIPYLIRPENFMNFFETNFSPRNHSNETEENELAAIGNMVKDVEVYNKLKDFSLEVFNKYFSMEEGVKNYMKVYANLLSEKNKSIPFYRHFKHRLKSLKSFFSFA